MLTLLQCGSKCLTNTKASESAISLFPSQRHEAALLLRPQCLQARSFIIPSIIKNPEKNHF